MKRRHTTIAMNHATERHPGERRQHQGRHAQRQRHDQRLEPTRDRPRLVVIGGERDRQSWNERHRHASTNAHASFPPLPHTPQSSNDVRGDAADQNSRRRRQTGSLCLAARTSATLTPTSASAVGAHPIPPPYEPLTRTRRS